MWGTKFTSRKYWYKSQELNQSEHASLRRAKLTLSFYGLFVYGEVDLNNYFQQIGFFYLNKSISGKCFQDWSCDSPLIMLITVIFELLTAHEYVHFYVILLHVLYKMFKILSWKKNNKSTKFRNSTCQRWFVLKNKYKFVI